MDDNQKREAIKQVYSNSKTWAAKVDKMSPTQVTAIFLRLQAERKL